MGRLEPVRLRLLGAGSLRVRAGRGRSSHNAAKQYALGAPVAREDLQPGDIVFFDRLRHNGIYIGDGRFIHARQTGKRVAIAGLDEAWYAERWVGARRIEPLPPVGDDEER